MNRALVVVSVITLMGLVAFAAYSYGRRSQPQRIAGSALIGNDGVLYKNTERLKVLRAPDGSIKEIEREIVVKRDE